MNYALMIYNFTTTRSVRQSLTHSCLSLSLSLSLVCLTAWFIPTPYPTPQ